VAAANGYYRVSRRQNLFCRRWISPDSPFPCSFHFCL